jgi:hypothetical protein
MDGKCCDEGHWYGHAESLSRGFWLGFAKILMFFPTFCDRQSKKQLHLAPMDIE